MEATVARQRPFFSSVQYSTVQYTAHAAYSEMRVDLNEEKLQVVYKLYASAHPLPRMHMLLIIGPRGKHASPYIYI